MKRIHYHLAASLVGGAIISLSAIGVASAASNTGSSTNNIGSSGISRSVFSQERLDAVAQVLNTTTSNVKTARQDKTLKSLISGAGLTKTTFRQKVRAQLITDLEGLGYSNNQITIALQHREIVRLRHHS